MATKVRKAIIPAAGYGTRFLPLTKTIPKEIVPIMDKPIIHYIV
ncbi:MAG: sugar phosphate nucleotidyltransferase, partial [Patescibacteria group bacterium]